MPSSVLICDPAFPLELVKEILPGAYMGPVGDGDPGVAVLVCSPDAPVSAADIARLPGLRAIVTASVGTDHIAMDAVRERGIPVVNVPDYCVEEVSDHALAMILALRRGLVAGDRAVRAGRWEWTDVGEIGRVAGTRLGVVGLGRIGRALADKADALRMEVRHHDPYVRGGVALDELLAWADAVSLHAPLTDDTRGMIDARRLALMRPGAILVNTGRGATVDRDALRDATHVLAAFDNVWERPPAPDLVALDHLTMTPYVAWYSPQSMERLYRSAARAALAALGSG